MRSEREKERSEVPASTMEDEALDDSRLWLLGCGRISAIGHCCQCETESISLSWFRTPTGERRALCRGCRAQLLSDDGEYVDAMDYAVSGGGFETSLRRH